MEGLYTVEPPIKKEKPLYEGHTWKFTYYSLFQLSWPRFRNGSSRVRCQPVGMPVEMYGESRQRGLEVRRPTVQHIAGLGRARGMHRRLNYIYSTKYAEVINASIVANSAGIDYSAFSIESVAVFALRVH